MNIYLISQDKNTRYGSYDSAVVNAKDEHSARLTHPDHERTDWNGDDWADWTNSENVKVNLIGVNNLDIACVICASFNAG
jgi:hypothetical protein